MQTQQNAPVVSIIIPTHNRARILNKCLFKILENNFPKNKYEIIVVDDASTDNTAEVVQEKCKNNSQIRYFKQKKSGQGVARNFGISKAQGQILIFIGDDIFISKNFILEHYQFHQSNTAENYAQLGLILWDPEINISELMEWSTSASTIFGRFGGHQFAFEKLTSNQPANYNFFYTSNISLKKSILEKEKFDPWFDGYGWEDIELGYRLEKNQSLKLIYNSQAIAYHHHEVSLAEFKKRMFQIGTASHLFQAKHRELQIVPNFKKKLVFIIISNKLSLKLIKSLNYIFKRKLNPIYFYCLSKHYYLQGLKIIPKK